MAYIGKAPVNGFHSKQSLTGDASTTSFALDFEPFDICSECDCVIKYKTALASAKCPIGKW